MSFSSNNDGNDNSITSTATNVSCHYQILGVSSQASIDEIKSAHRSLALRLHPDKQQQIQQNKTETDNTNTRSNDITTSMIETKFRQVQVAWECLRDPIKRQEYDDELQRKQEKIKSRKHGATRIYLSEMQECMDDDNEKDQGNNNTVDGYAHECRCGEYVELWKDDITVTATHASNEEVLIDCPGCCLSYCIVLDKSINE